jgi:hypothetical protein
MGHGVAEEEHAKAGKDGAWQHEDQAEFGFTGIGRDCQCRERTYMY